MSDLGGSPPPHRTPFVYKVNKKLADADLHMKRTHLTSRISFFAPCRMYLYFVQVYTSTCTQPASKFDTSFLYEFLERMSGVLL